MTGHAIAEMKLRELVLALLPLAQKEGPPAAPALAESRRALCKHVMPILRRYAAGDDVTNEDLHFALASIKAAALVTADQGLFIEAAVASSACLKLCSPQFREDRRREDERSFRSLGIPTLGRPSQ